MSDLAKQLIEKTSYINDVKQAIKRAIEDKGQTIEDDLSFYSYADKIRQITAMEGAVKLFETKEEMQLDNTSKEGDLAVVYRNGIQNMTADTQPQFITFPETVTLPEVFTGSSFMELRAVDESVMFDGSVQLNQTSFRFDNWAESDNIRVEYSSSDGITYNRTRFSGDSGDLTNPVDLGTSVKVHRSEEWNDNMGYFMQIGGMTFDGLFEYSDSDATDKFLLNGCKFLDGQGTTVGVDKADFDFSDVPFNEAQKMATGDDYENRFILVPISWTDTTIQEKTIHKVTECWLFNDANSVFVKNNSVAYLASVDVDGNAGINIWSKTNGMSFIPASSLEEFVTNTTITTASTRYSEYNLKDKYIFDIQVIGSSIKLESNQDAGFYYFDTDSFPTDVNRAYTIVKMGYSGTIIKEFIFAPTQYTLTSPNQLLPNISAYGKNGNIIGDGSIYDDLDMNVRWKLLSGDKLLTENLNDWTFIGMTGSHSITAGDVVSPQPEENYYCAQIKQENIFEEGFNAKFSEILGETYVDNYAEYVGIYNNQLYFLCLCAITENSKYSVKLVRFNLDYSLVDVTEIIQFNTTAPSGYSKFIVDTDYSTVLFSTVLGTSNKKVYLFDVNTLEYTNIINMSTSSSIESMQTKGDYCYVLTRTGVGRINLATKTYEQSYMTFSEAEGYVFKLETDSHLYFGYEVSDYTLSIVECIEKKTYSYANFRHPDSDNTIVDDEVNVAYIYKRNNYSTTTVLEVSETGIEEVTYTNKGKMGNDYVSDGYWFKDNNNLVLVPFTKPGLSSYFLVLNPVSKTITYGLLTYNYDIGEYFKDKSFIGGSHSTNPKSAKIEIINDCVKYTNYTSMVNIFILLYKNCSLQRGVLSNTVTTGFACNDSDSGIALKTLTSKDITDVFNPVDYTGTISPEEYTTALNTANEIKGGNA